MEYKHGIDYPTNGQRPNLPDDVIVCFAGKHGFYPYSNPVSYWDWHDATAFRIVDDRYKAAKRQGVAE